MKAANADLARDKETFQLTIATQSGRIEELVTTRDQLSGEAERVKEQLADVSLRNKQLYKSYISYKDAYKQASAHLEAINQTDGKVWLKPVSGTNPPFLPLSARKTAIISLANLKGGVGKTTLTANLGGGVCLGGFTRPLGRSGSPEHSLHPFTRRPGARRGHPDQAIYSLCLH